MLTEGQGGLMGMARWKVVVTAALMSAAGAVAAHESGKHFRGVVKGISSDQLVLETPTGEVSVQVGPQTRVTRVGAKEAGAAPTVGDRAVVHARAAEGGRLEATEVKLGRAPGGSR